MSERARSEEEEWLKGKNKNFLKTKREREGGTTASVRFSIIPSEQRMIWISFFFFYQFLISPFFFFLGF